jgi:hypothetical protein
MKLTVVVHTVDLLQPKVIECASTILDATPPVWTVKGMSGSESTGSRRKMSTTRARVRPIVKGYFQ